MGKGFIRKYGALFSPFIGSAVADENRKTNEHWRQRHKVGISVYELLTEGHCLGSWVGLWLREVVSLCAWAWT